MEKFTDFFSSSDESALQAIEKAQQIAFAPVVFQATRVLRNTGILQVIEDSQGHGITLPDVAAKVSLPLYGARVLLESGLSIGLVYKKEEHYFLTKTGHFILHDELTRVNMDFIHDVCSTRVSWL